MKLRDLLKKFKVNIELSENVLNLEITGEYNNMDKTKVFLDSFTKQGFVKQEYDAYKFTGEYCECFVAPLSRIRTVSCYYKKENYSHGCSYDENGSVTAIV